MMNRTQPRTAALRRSGPQRPRIVWPVNALARSQLQVGTLPPAPQPSGQKRIPGGTAKLAGQPVSAVGLATR
jgi:hypothetical protein